VTDALIGTMGLDAADWLKLFGHFLMLSLLAIGGAITTAPDMHRLIVGQQGWLSDAQFSASIALAQAAPGPNVLFVAVLGFNVAGLAGALVTLAGTLLPSTLLTLSVTRWGDKRRESRALRAFTSGLAPLTLGLLLATGWILTEPVRGSLGAMLLVPFTVTLMLVTKISPIWLVAAGALAGVFGMAG